MNFFREEDGKREEEGWEGGGINGWTKGMISLRVGKSRGWGGGEGSEYS